MLQQLDLKGSIDIQDTGLKNYLVIKMGSERKILLYQIEMIRHNPHMGLISLEKHYYNDQVHLTYDISGKKSWRELFEEGRIQKVNVFDYLQKTIEIMLEAKAHLLHPGGFLLDVDYIFLSNETLKPAFVYLPFLPAKEIKENLYSLSKSLFSQIEAEEKLHDEILNYLSHSWVSLEAFLAYLHELYYLPRVLTGKTIKGTKSFSLETNFAEPEEIKVPDNQESSIQEGVDNKRKKRLAVFITCQLVFALLLVIVSSQPFSKNSLVPYVVLGGIFIVVDYFLLRSLVK